MTTTIKNKRIWELDFLRGLAIIMMVFDHFMFDFAYLPNYFSNFYEVNHPFFNWLNDFARMYWNSTLRFFGREFFVLLFLLISGISFTFSKDNFKRGFKMLLVALVITGVTWIIDLTLNFGVLIVFGVIHMFAVNTLIVALMRKYIKSEIILLFIGMLIITFSFIYGFFTPTSTQLSLTELPKIIIGINSYGADHFGILPYLGIILIGTVVGKTFYSQRVSLVPQVQLSSRNIFLLTGKYSLYVYVIHQPIVLGIVAIIAYSFGFRF
jgi:uncharacterized membrane protein